MTTSLQDHNKSVNAQFIFHIHSRLRQCKSYGNQLRSDHEYHDCQVITDHSRNVVSCYFTKRRAHTHLIVM